MNDRILLIVAHPDSTSFNHAIASCCRDALLQAGCHVDFHDLYAESFNPLLPSSEIARDATLEPQLARHCEELAAADAILIVHPNWWGQPPAILKGWIDRVVRPGVAYRFDEDDAGEGIPVGLLRARVAVVFNTANTPHERELAVFGDPLDTLWRNCVFGLCGVSHTVRRTFSVVITSTYEQRACWLAEAQTILLDSLA
ncbi:MAG: NAD(P)H-dependent oxidoreductase [Chloroflexota bacterium]